MDTINIRYGETVTLPLQTGDTSAVSADIYIGKPGEMYTITKHITISEGSGVFVLSQTDTRVPLGTYYYQVNVTDAAGNVEKYPSPEETCDGCEEDPENSFPMFIVREALDETEVS